MARIGIIGSEGRMGRAIAAALEAGRHEAAGGIDAGGDPAALARMADALVDFSAPDGLEANLVAAADAGVPILVGTTGLGDAHHAAIDRAAQAIPMLQTGNTSLGVTLLAALVARAAAALDWDVEIVETHHAAKRDAPSGTALLLGEAAAGARGMALDPVTDRDRVRADGSIGFASLRGGTVAGDHSVLLLGEQERLILSHIAEDRAIFARGAIRAAAWLIGKPPGRYAMADMLGL